MRHMSYQMHTGNSLAGWISLACGLAAFILYVKYLRITRR